MPAPRREELVLPASARARRVRKGESDEEDDAGERAKGVGGGRGRGRKSGKTEEETRKRRREEEIEYIRGVAARKVKRLSADDKTASRRPAASKGACARAGLARTVIGH